MEDIKQTERELRREKLMTMEMVHEKNMNMRKRGGSRRGTRKIRNINDVRSPRGSNC